jgi:mannose-6-phosphate isomerase-like protein (cupin superfamily)
VSAPEVRVRLGRLDPTAPLAGERFVDLVTICGSRVEHIVSSESPDPVEQVQEWDEWVLVLSGAAQLEIEGRRHDVSAGDWLVLPAGTPHRVLHTRAGTQWIAVHGPPGSPGGACGPDAGRP